MWIILAALLFLAFLSTARYATPAQKAATPARVQRFVFWSWLVLAPIVVWTVWDIAGWGWGVVSGAVILAILVDSRRKGWSDH